MIKHFKELKGILMILLVRFKKVHKVKHTTQLLAFIFATSLTQSQVAVSTDIPVTDSDLDVRYARHL